MTNTAPDWLNLFDGDPDADDRGWLPTKHKKASLAVADAFDELGGRYKKLASRMRQCGEFLEFACYRIGDSEQVTRRLVRCSWCRVRLCFLCERAKSRKRHAQLIELMDAWLRRRPTDQVLLLTLTVPSVGDDDLAAAVGHLISSVRRLTRSARFKQAVR